MQSTEGLALRELLQGSDGERPLWVDARGTSSALVQDLSQSSEPGKPGHAAERRCLLILCCPAVCWCEQPCGCSVYQIQTPAGGKCCLALEQFPIPAHAGAAQTLPLARGEGKLRNRRGWGERLCLPMAAPDGASVNAQGTTAEGAQQDVICPLCLGHI